MATVGIAVAVSILVARVTACVRVGPPSAELAACVECKNEFYHNHHHKGGVISHCNTHLQSLIAVSNEFLMKRYGVLQRIHKETQKIKWRLTEKRNSKTHTHKKNEDMTVYLLHFGVEVNVAVSNDELYGFISNVLVWRFHSDPPDEVHPSQIQSLHTLKETIIRYHPSRWDFPTNFTENKQESHTSCVPCRLRRWSLRFTFSKKVLKRLNPAKH